MKENQLAAPLMFFGVVLMVYSLAMYPPLQVGHWPVVADRPAWAR